MPGLPLEKGPNGTIIAFAETISSAKHNSEGPELYAMHPHRMYTKGRQIASGTDISLGERTVAGSSWAKSGRQGWNYGINAYALIGDAAAAEVRAVRPAPISR